MTALLIIKTGTTVTGLAERRGDFEHWILEALERPLPSVKVVSVWEGEHLPELNEVAAVIITGSAAMVTDREVWSEYTASWLQEAVNQSLPVLGICYGHQLLAHALGGTVDYHPRGREIGTVDVCLTETAVDDPLFKGSSGCFLSHVSHSQTVLKLPEGAVILANNDFEPHHAVRYAPGCWGLQYHPEFDEDIMSAYINARHEALSSEGLDPAALLTKVSNSEESAHILQRFLQLAMAGVD